MNRHTGQVNRIENTDERFHVRPGIPQYEAQTSWKDVYNLDGIPGRACFN